MAFRLYIVPVIVDNTKTYARRFPKYFWEGGFDLDYTAKDFGFENLMIVGADLSVSDDNMIVGQVDVTALPFDLASILTSAQVSAIQARLESLNIPAEWVNTSLTWLFVARTVLGMFSFVSAFASIYFENTGNAPPSLFASGRNLNTIFSALPTAVRTAMIDTATRTGVSTDGLTANSTLRQILKELADQYQSVQYGFSYGVML